jgi:hypothetical protein
VMTPPRTLSRQKVAVMSLAVVVVNSIILYR